MTRLILLTGGISIFLLSATIFSRNKKNEETGEKLAIKYCGTCHKVPNPKTFNKYVWQVNVLPAMASLLGVNYMGYDPYRGMQEEEIEILKQRKYYPENTLIDKESWEKIVQYYVDNAPEKSITDSSRYIRNAILASFKTRYVKLGSAKSSNVTAISYDTIQKELWVSEPNKLVLTRLFI